MCLHVEHGRIIDRHFFVGGNMHCIRPCFSLHKQIDDTSVGEGSPSHDQIVASATTIRIEVTGLDMMLGQELPGRRLRGNIAGRGDVVCRDGVPKQAQHIRPLDIWNVR